MTQRLQQPALVLTVVTVITVMIGCTFDALGAPAVALRGSVQVPTEWIRLSDLLPATAPAQMRERARPIVLGHAPQPGQQRTISGSYIAGQLSGFPDLLEALWIPGEVVVKRANRRMGAAEIFPALRQALDASGCASVILTDGSQLELPASVRVTSDNPEVEVIGVESDSVRKQVRFRLRLVDADRSVPFYATMPMTDQYQTMIRGPRDVSSESPDGGLPPVDRTCLEFLRAGPSPTRKTDAPAQRAASPRLPILARAGQSATLQIFRPDMRIQMPVVPLEHGVAGQMIRVRLSATKQVIQGTVIGPNLLESTF